MARTLACLALGATLGLIAATWQTRPSRPTSARAVETPANRPDCCSQVGSSRTDRLGPARSGFRIDDGAGVD